MSVVTRPDQCLRPPAYQIIELLERSSFTFHLTGSRFFGTARPHSDWDFFTQQSPEVEDFLEDHAFTRVNEMEENALTRAYQGDVNIARVYEKDDVQVQAVKDVRLKEVAQMILLDLPPSVSQAFLRAKTRAETRSWWTWAYKMAEKYAPKS